MKPIQISEDQWNREYHVYLCELPVFPQDLSAILGIKFETEFEDGLGRIEFAYLQFEHGQVMLAAHPDGPANLHHVHLRVSGAQLEPQALMQEALEAFEIPESSLPWVSDVLHEPPWVLYRLDDNGNEFEMKRFLSDVAAEHVRRQYEAKGHKQTYTVRRAEKP